MKHFLLKTCLIVVCLLMGAGTMWAENADYTLTPSAGSNNSYTGNCDVTVEGITWNVAGNASIVPWRLGGKSISNVDRTVYSKTAYTSAVSKVDLTVGAASSITINSLKLVYSTNSDFSNSSEISKTFTANSTISFEGNFPANAYYKFVFNVTVSSTSNKFVEFSKVEFYNSGAVDTRTAVNITEFSATSTTLTKGDNTTTSVSNDQNGWTASYTYESSNTNVATVDNDGIITAVEKGTAKITASLNIDNDDASWKKGATASKTIDITVNNPSHTAHFSVNGTIDPVKNASVEEGSAITFPANPEVADVVFKGWATAAIDGTQDDAPTFVNTATETMGTNDVTYYAVFATEEGGGETLLETVGFESSEGYTATTTYNSTSYTTGSTGSKWKINYGAFATSSAIIGSQSAQFRIYSSGGGYGQLMNTVAYSSDITKVEYSAKAANSNGQVKVSYSTNGSSWTDITTQSLNTTIKEYSAAVPVSGVRYIKFTAAGTKPSSGNYSIYVDGVKITAGIGTTYVDYCTTVGAPKPTPTLSFANPTYNATIGEDFTAPILTNTEGVTVSYSSSETGVATVDGNGAVELVAAGTTTITASFAGNDTYDAASASYELVVAAAPAQKYKVTIVTPENGTLTVKDGETVVNDGDEVEEGTELTIECTPADGFKFVNWGYKDGSANWVGNMTTTFTHIMPSAPCSFKATFVEIPVYTVAFSVNGVEVQSDNLKEGAAVTVPDDPEAINGKVFTGWIETSTVVGETPAYVTPITTATKTVTYYAVFATYDSEATPDQWQTTTLSALTSSDVFVMASGTNAISSANGTSGNPAAVALTVSAGKITSEVTDAIKWTLTGNATDGYTFYKNGSTDYLYVNTTASSSSNTCIRVGTQNSNIRNNWKPDNNGYLKTNDSYTARYLSFYSTGSDFRGYVNTSNGAFAPTFYKLIPGGETYTGYTTTVAAPLPAYGELNFVATTGNDNYYATFSCDRDVIFDAEQMIEVQTIFVLDNEMAITKVSDNSLSAVTDKTKDEGWVAGYYVPANTGVLVYSAGNEPAKYYYTEANVYNILEDVDEDNMLEPCPTTGIFKEEADGSYYYKLAYGDNTNKKKLGFWWGAEDGNGNFNVKAGGAVLVVPQSQAGSNLRGFSFDYEDTLTGLDALEIANDSVIYNIQGQRITRVQQGVNIVNGKKVIR